MIGTFHRGAIDQAAATHLLEADLVEALVIVESGGFAFAWNPEPAYRYLWNVRTRRPFRAVSSGEVLSKFPPADFPAIAGDRDQEWWGQQASWGLMQVMGAVARERGFVRPYLPELCDVGTNLDLGCGHLATQLEWADGDVHKALAAYNAGRGGWLSTAAQAYANKVDRKHTELRTARL